MTARTHKWISRTLLALATLMLLLACLGTWADRQLLQTDHWVDTSSALLRDADVQDATAAYLSDQIAQNATGERLAERLPERLKPLAPQAAAALSELSERVAKRALESGAFQTLWEESNRRTHEQLVALIEGKTVLGRGVVLDLRPMLGKLGERVGLGSDFVDQLPPDRGVIRIASPDEVETLQTAARLLQDFALVTTILTLLLFAAAIAMAGERRRKVLMSTGLSIAGVGLMLLVIRRVAGASVVEALTSGGAGEPAAAATWSIGTSVLQDIAQAAVVVGLVLILAALLAGPAGWAVKARRFAAPAMREQSGLVWGGAALVTLLLLAWAPLPFMSTVFGALLFLALAAGGLAVLQRQVQREYPA